MSNTDFFAERLLEMSMDPIVIRLRSFVSSCAILVAALSTATLLTGCAKFFAVLGISSDTGFVVLPNLVASPDPVPTPAPLSCDPAIANDYGGGDGSADSPYTLCTLAHWNHFASQSSDWDSHFKLEADLDFSTLLLADFVSIGDGTTAFTGSFDGAGHAIKNIDYTAAGRSVALFGKTSGNVAIKNLKLEDVSITSNTRSEWGGNVRNSGGFVGGSSDILDSIVPFKFTHVKLMLTYASATMPAPFQPDSMFKLSTFTSVKLEPLPMLYPTNPPT